MSGVWFYTVWPEGQPEKAKYTRSAAAASWHAWVMGMSQFLRPWSMARRINTARTTHCYLQAEVLDGMPL